MWPEARPRCHEQGSGPGWTHPPLRLLQFTDQVSEAFAWFARKECFIVFSMFNFGNANVSYRLIDK